MQSSRLFRYLPFQGSIFFPLPDGTGLLYNMTGFSDQPRPITTVTNDIPAKTQHTEVFQNNTQYINIATMTKLNRGKNSMLMTVVLYYFQLILINNCVFTLVI